MGKETIIFNSLYENRYRLFNKKTGNVAVEDIPDAVTRDYDVSRMFGTNPIKILREAAVNKFTGCKYKDYKYDGDKFTMNGFVSDETGRICLKTDFGKHIFVLTKNPVDIIFCATGQNHTSCYRLAYSSNKESELHAISKQNNVYMAFLSERTKENEKYGATIPAIVGRMFVYNDRDSPHLWFGGRPYGHWGTELRLAFRNFMPFGYNNVNIPPVDRETGNFNDNVFNESEVKLDRYVERKYIEHYLDRGGEIKWK